jgi:hypothetical protein
VPARVELPRPDAGTPECRVPGGFGGEAAHQLGSGLGEEFARQLFGSPRSRRRGR